MTSKPPPVPPANQSHKGPGDHKSVPVDQTPHGLQRGQNPDKQGQQANTKQNTTHQGYQQDR
jgi:hypothetical protein